MLGVDLENINKPKIPHKMRDFWYWRRRQDSNLRGVAPKRFSRPPRCDRFDTPPRFLNLLDDYIIFFKKKQQLELSFFL